MSTLTVTTTPTAVNDGTAPIVHLGNSGDRPITVSWGSKTQILNPGFSLDVRPNGAAVTATVASGTGVLALDITGKPNPPGGAGSGSGSTVSADGSGNLVINGDTFPLTTDAELAAALAALNGAYAPLGLVADSVTYNPDGTVATSTEGGVTTTYTYNSDGTVATEARLGKTKTYTYDGSGNLTGSTVA